MQAVTQPQVLGPPEWAARRDAHQARVRAWTDPHLDRAVRREAHPVLDFLFTYYNHSPGALRRWHPGAGVVLAGDAPHRDWAGYVSVEGGVTASLSVRPGQLVRDTVALLRATAARRPVFGCHGMHEWAMVYRSSPEQVRHAAWPLRLAPAELDAVVESAPLRCTHFDAFRFFTEPARPLNVLTPSRTAMPDLEQGGCLHTNMDLYKHAYRLSPLVPSELVADCFELAREIRTLDMRASPYDLADLGYAPVRIETAEGKAEYVEAQRAFAERAAPLRQRLIAALRTDSRN
ncbi:3-methyladenine DNA glycosylase [Sporichthya sp.]|uniref:3-methyladenine DNA glycosylase n=1 Tax=Sporichthya sp. TaxID=65475 RepID=UPI0017C04855|nr:3-methyladenine DNA glycosylase [Sporichthya sp.]MBA3741748.1 3-methyladenine DNA glycosylase [Sporichthya sp.]